MGALNYNPETDPVTTGVKFVLGIAKGISSTQSVLFDKAIWSVEQARKWLAEHGLKSEKLDKSGKYLRFRQRPAKYKQYATIDAGHGSNPANLFGFGGKTTYSAKGKDDAIKAGRRIGDTAGFDSWYLRSGYEAKGVDKKFLKKYFDQGVESPHGGKDEPKPASHAQQSKAEEAAYRAGLHARDEAAFDLWLRRSGYEGLDITSTLRRQFQEGLSDRRQGKGKGQSYGYRGSRYASKPVRSEDRPTGYRQGDKCPFWHWKGHEICRTEEGEYYDRKDPASRFESLKAVKKFIEDWEKGRRGNAVLYTVIAQGNRKYAMARTLGEARTKAAQLKAEYGAASIWNGPELVERTNPESPEVSMEVVESEIPVFRSGPQGFPGVTYLIAYPELNQTLAYAQAIKGVYPDVGVVCLQESEEKQPGGDYAVVANANQVRVVEVDQVAEEADTDVRIENPEPWMLSRRQYEMTGMSLPPGSPLIEQAAALNRQISETEREIMSLGRHLWNNINQALNSPKVPRALKDRYRSLVLERKRVSREADRQASHRFHVATALAAGHPVPPEVVAEYPELRTNPKERRNPEQAAAEMYESFHGRPSDRTLEIEESIHEHDWLAELGDLTELEVDTVSGYHATISFDANHPKLASSEDGQQLFIVGGEQSLDLGKLHMSGSKWERDSMVIGEVTNIVYRTEKSSDRFESLEYTHKAGEESDVQPQLVYEPKSPRLLIFGGQYRINKPLIGTSPGIEN